MKNWKLCALTVTCLAAFALSAPDYADAKRIGGGRSFGSSPSMRNTAPAPRAPAGATTTQPGSTMNRQGQNAAPAAGAATASRGFLGGMGGIMGGLLAGSLIGSMLSGNGLAGAGGGMMDIVLIGLIAYIGYRIFRRRSTQNAAPRTEYNASPMPSSGTSSGASAWDNLTSRPQPNTDMPLSDAIPADFDQEDFLRGAKMAYIRMQESWDKRDLDDIAQFASPAVLEELQTQLREEPEPTVTELLLVNASLMEVKNDADTQRAAVYFDVLMRESPTAAQPEQVREVWHFARAANSANSWKLDGIQQVN